MTNKLLLGDIILTTTTEAQWTQKSHLSVAFLQSSHPGFQWPLLAVMKVVPSAYEVNYGKQEGGRQLRENDYMIT